MTELLCQALAALPAYAATLWGDLGEADGPPVDAEALLSEVASRLASEVATLAAPGVDGGPVWLVTASTAASGFTSLDRIAGWSKGKVAAIPQIVASRADGVPGLRSVYRGEVHRRDGCRPGAAGHQAGRRKGRAGRLPRDRLHRGRESRCAG